MPINFTIVKRGYNPVEVDNYIKSLEQQINEFKEKSSAINNAIINAQLAADNIIKDAHMKTDQMLSNAENDATAMKQKTLSQIAGIKNNIASQKRLMEAFQNDYNMLIKKYLSPIETEDVMPMLSKLNEIESLIDNLANPAPAKPEKSIEESAAARLAQSMESQPLPSSYRPEIEKPKQSMPVSPYMETLSEEKKEASSMDEFRKLNNPFKTEAENLPDYRRPVNPYAMRSKEIDENRDSEAYQKTVNPFNNKRPSSYPPMQEKNNADELEKPQKNEEYDILLNRPQQSPSNSKPGVYKATDLYNDLDSVNNLSDDDFIPSNSGLTKAEMEEFMPKKNR